MSLSIGIVGLPNVGKSTLFNALTKNKVPAENYPFNTIEPNVGVVAVHDDRLDKLEEIVKPEKKVPAVIKFVDIAGLVKGAHKGEGLGNKFLSHIREVDAIVQVVRAFESSDVTHVENRVDPLADIDILETELVLKDLEAVERKWGQVERDREVDEKTKEFSKGLLDHLAEGKLAFNFKYEGTEEEIKKFRKELFLLTDKPLIYLINQSVNKHESEDMKKLLTKLQGELLFLDVKMESELTDLSDEEKKEYLEGLGLERSGFEKLTQLSYKMLGLISFFTAGPMEVRAWTITAGAKVPQAAGVIHTDFEQKFIAADVVSYGDFVDFSGWEGAREKGKVRLEGKEYIVKDGDVMLFKHGV
ncbi:redox-regulated ATPase YchF [Candidatus Dojkabacteria bacterium]|nr:redox-regulated ATPase YchF [Candidatus Dojkabacteria bacterium]